MVTKRQEDEKQLVPPSAAVFKDGAGNIQIVENAPDTSSAGVITLTPSDGASSVDLGTDNTGAISLPEALGLDNGGSGGSVEIPGGLSLEQVSDLYGGGITPREVEVPSTASSRQERYLASLEKRNELQEQLQQQQRVSSWAQFGVGIGATATSTTAQLLLTALKARTERRIAREQLAQERWLLDQRLARESEINEAREESAANRTAALVSILNSRNVTPQSSSPRKA